MDGYDISGACGSILSFIDSLNNWYVRRSRDRFWAADQAAVDTLHTVLTLLCRVAAPLLPLTTEAVYLGLTTADARTGASVHFTHCPPPAEAPADGTLAGAKY